jgi:hypothetical protein
MTTFARRILQSVVLVFIYILVLYWMQKALCAMASPGLKIEVIKEGSNIEASELPVDCTGLEPVTPTLSK